MTTRDKIIEALKIRDMSASEISKHIDMPVGAVNSSLQRMKFLFRKGRSPAIYGLNPGSRFAISEAAFSNPLNIKLTNAPMHKHK